ncbi:MAG: TonB-dependent receptor [Acidobacteriales bacterium]|nr:TonB-dependent receptor [Terriglobales bacterium]
MRVTICAISLCFAFFFPQFAHSQTFTIEGTVRDGSGAAIAGAIVSLRGGDYQTHIQNARSQTDGAGRFKLAEVRQAAAVIHVEAAGFAAVDANWTTDQQELQIVLRPIGVSEQVIVSAARIQTQLDESPGSGIVFSRVNIAAAPSLTVDDMLRQVPGFSLFRRTSSRFANPTTMGVSLRGLGASGASRAIVLEDGVPLSDPFGGWVYWERVPPESLSGAEIFRGGSSSLYGSGALGGVVQLFSREPSGPVLSVETSYGNENTPDLSLWTGEKWGPWDAELEGDLFSTGGYLLVPSSERGSVDTPVNSEHGDIGAGVGHQIGAAGRAFLKGSFFDDSRNNGTHIQTNEIRIAHAGTGIDIGLGNFGSVVARAYGDAQRYRQDFSAIASDRMSESLTNVQHVPAQDAGINAQWARAFGKIQTLLAGVDFREVIGSSDEQIFSSATGTLMHTFNTTSGGRQRNLGFFGEDIIRIRKWTVIASTRVDDWRNYRGILDKIPVTAKASPAFTNYPDRSESAFSPRLSLIRPITSNISVTASGYRAFRAPTLNELYRSFRQGNVITSNNPDLRAERLTGAEGGVNAVALAGRLRLRGTYFWSEIVNPIANVTLATTPTLITRQRQNLGRTQSQGLELDAVLQLSESVGLAGGYAFTDATVLSFPAETALQGLRIPQVPRQQFTLEARYWNPSKLMLTLQGRFVGTQYDDDQNLLPLDRFFTVNFMASRNLGRGAAIFAAAENLFNERYVVALTPIQNLGPPILFRVGLKLDIPTR